MSEILNCPVSASDRSILSVQTFYPWASLTTRLWKGAEHLEVEWTVGPIPFKDGLGREISVRCCTPLGHSAALPVLCSCSISGLQNGQTP